MTIEADKPLWVTILEGLGNLGNNIWDELGKALGFEIKSPPKLTPSKPKYLLENRINFQQYPVYNNQITPNQNISWLDLPIHQSSDKSWREVLGGIGKDIVIGGGITAIIMGIASLAERRHNLYPHFITEICRLPNDRVRRLRNMGLGEQRISQIQRITISDDLKNDARVDFNRNMNRNLEHARLTSNERADYELCFVAQNFNGHFIHAGDIDINPVKICILSQDHHINNLIPNYLNYEHRRVGERIPRGHIILLDANILIDYERSRTENNEALTLEAQRIDAIFDNAETNNNKIWITDRIASQFLPSS